jgi:tetratricopeptide (TPR) repeat protein
VFIDVDGIAPGADFVTVISQTITRCRIALVVIGPTWLGTAEMPSRLHDPKDFVRIEVTLTLAAGLRLIPVLVGKASVPAAQDLPKDIERITQLQAVAIRDERFDSDVDALLRALGWSARRHALVTHWRWLALTILAFATTALLLGGYNPLRRRTTPSTVLERSPAASHAAVPEPVDHVARQQTEHAARLYDLGRYEQAIKELTIAYEGAGDPKMLYNLAQANRKLNRLPEAYKLYENYLERFPADEPARKNLRRVALLMKARQGMEESRYEQARKDLTSLAREGLDDSSVQQALQELTDQRSRAAAARDRSSAKKVAVGQGDADARQRR